MSEYKWIYAVGEIDPELVEEASREKADPRAAEWPEYGRQTRKNGRWDSVAMRNIRRAAIIVFAALVMAFGLLMMNEKVRAAVFNFFTKQDKHVVKRDEYGVKINFGDPEKKGSSSSEGIDVQDVTVGYIPEGLAVVELQDVDSPNERTIRLETGEGIKDVFSPFVQIKIGRSGEFEPGFGTSTYDKQVYESVINGMDALLVSVVGTADEKEVRTCAAVFGDEKITVMMFSQSISMEEFLKIAEGIIW